MSDLNVWGTDKTLVDAEEFCAECERPIPLHYNNCPARASRPETTGGE